MINNNKAIGQAVRKRREELKLTLRGCAELAGVDHTLLLRLEQGADVRLSQFLKIQRLLKIEMPK